MDAFLVVADWGTAFISGGLAALGVVGVVSGRVFFGSPRDWSVGEAKQLGWSQVVAGLSLGLFALGQGVGDTNATLLAGHTWLRLVMIPLMFIFAGAMLFQSVIRMRHEQTRRLQGPS
jgi:hypothetical protein